MRQVRLIETIRDLDSYDERSTIYARKPWTTESLAVVASELASGIPPEVERLNMDYFLEVFLAREFLSGWIANLEQKPTLEEQCERLIRYATDDA